MLRLFGTIDRKLFLINQMEYAKKLAKEKEQKEQKKEQKRLQEEAAQRKVIIDCFDCFDIGMPFVRVVECPKR